MEVISTTGVRDVAVAVAGVACHFILGTENVPFGGGECVVYALESESGYNNNNNKRLCLRVPRTPIADASQMVLAEVLFRRSMEREGVPFCQGLLGHDVSSNNPIGRPFIALVWADGVQLEWTDTRPSDQGHRDKIIAAIAEYNVKLLGIRQSGAFPKFTLTREERC